MIANDGKQYLLEDEACEYMDIQVSFLKALVKHKFIKLYRYGLRKIKCYSRIELDNLKQPITIDTASIEELVNINRRGIYGLRHPHTKRVYYVGKSTNILKRYGEHISSGASLLTTPVRQIGNKEEWIVALLSEGLLPEIVLLQTFTGVRDFKYNSFRLEQFWILRLSLANEPLTNAQLKERSHIPIESNRYQWDKKEEDKKEEIELQTVSLSDGLYVKTDEACKFLGVSSYTLGNYRYKYDLTRKRKGISNVNYYLLSDLERIKEDREKLKR